MNLEYFTNKKSALITVYWNNVQSSHWPPFPHTLNYPTRRTSQTSLSCTFHTLLDWPETPKRQTQDLSPFRQENQPVISVAGHGHVDESRERQNRFWGYLNLLLSDSANSASFKSTQPPTQRFVLFPTKPHLFYCLSFNSFFNLIRLEPRKTKLCFENSDEPRRCSKHLL